MKKKKLTRYERSRIHKRHRLYRLLFCVLAGIALGTLFTHELARLGADGAIAAAFDSIAHWDDEL